MRSANVSVFLQHCTSVSALYAGASVANTPATCVHVDGFISSHPHPLNSCTAESVSLLVFRYFFTVFTSCAPFFFGASSLFGFSSLLLYVAYIAASFYSSLAFL